MNVYSVRVYRPDETILSEMLVQADAPILALSKTLDQSPVSTLSAIQIDIDSELRIRVIRIS